MSWAPHVHFRTETGAEQHLKDPALAEATETALRQQGHTVYRWDYPLQTCYHCHGAPQTRPKVRHATNVRAESLFEDSEKLF